MDQMGSKRHNETTYFQAIEVFRKQWKDEGRYQINAAAAKVGVDRNTMSGWWKFGIDAIPNKRRGLPAICKILEAERQGQDTPERKAYEAIRPQYPLPPPPPSNVSEVFALPGEETAPAPATAPAECTCPPGNTDPGNVCEYCFNRSKPAPITGTVIPPEGTIRREDMPTLHVSGSTIRREDMPVEALKVTGIYPPGKRTADGELDPNLYITPEELQRHGAKSVRDTLKVLTTLKNVIEGSAVMASRGLQTLIPVMQKAHEQLARQAADQVMPQELMEKVPEYNKSYAQALNLAAASIKVVIETEKLLLGAPTSIIGVLTPPPPPPKTEAATTGDPVDPAKMLEAFMAMGAEPDKAQAYVPETNTPTGDEEDE